MKQKKEKSAQHKLARQNFDRKFKHKKAAYKRNLEIELEENVSTDPNEFWTQIKNLGPKKQNETNFEVYDENGHITSDINLVLKQWEDCSKELFDDKNDPTFDNTFLEQKLAELEALENQARTTQHHSLNESILDEEIGKGKG